MHAVVCNLLSESYSYQSLRNGNHSSHVDCGERNSDESLFFGAITSTASHEHSSSIITSRSLTTSLLSFTSQASIDGASTSPANIDGTSTSPTIAHESTTISTTSISTTQPSNDINNIISQLKDKVNMDLYDFVYQLHLPLLRSTMNQD